MTNKTLAQTFKDVAQHGRDGFYQGRVAEEIIARESSLRDLRRVN